ncbi:hypothetical protein B5M43_014330 [Microbacterium sp. MEC084]|uniref:hypothetical protein n=1 Tax=Microbacterium sp. MEC084 TaxID=1963027 RepID=UPI00106F5CF2|nr:hypothetical protein [Microbacterium sp. MEC084]MCD1269992.1 hypothetical protein [Microbacterium sp. MEC084]
MGKVTLTHTLSPAEIHAAFNAIAEAHLCCDDEMRRECYGYGRAQDEDLILQKATSGEIIYG